MNVADILTFTILFLLLRMSFPVRSRFSLAYSTRFFKIRKPHGILKPYAHAEHTYKSDRCSWYVLLKDSVHKTLLCSGDASYRTSQRPMGRWENIIVVFYLQYFSIRSLFLIFYDQSSAWLGAISSGVNNNNNKRS